MKKYMLLLVGLLLISAGWIVWNVSVVLRNAGEISIPKPVIQKPTEIPATGDFRIDVITVASGSSVTLIPNYSQKIDSKTIIEKNNCVSAINGGFYTKSNTPLGLVEINNETIAPEIESSLVNGFLWVDEDGAGIGSSLPVGARRFAIQSGPLLVTDSNALTLSTTNDFHSRRMVAAATKDTLFFMAVYNDESVFDGPLLKELPDLIMNYSDENKLGIIDAINLDGGSASTFYSEAVTLSELTPVGSLFCIQ